MSISAISAVASQQLPTPNHSGLQRQSAQSLQHQDAEELPSSSSAPAETSARRQLDETAQLSEFRRIDRQVRAHEQAHARVGGPHAGPPQYTFERGPDGRNYAVAGRVDIDLSPVPGDPEATIEKMETVQAAALAPLNPSAQDRRVAAQARSQAIRAEQELTQQQTQPNSESSGRRINLFA